MFLDFLSSLLESSSNSPNIFPPSSSINLLFKLYWASLWRTIESLFKKKSPIIAEHFTGIILSCKIESRTSRYLVGGDVTNRKMLEGDDEGEGSENVLRSVGVAGDGDVGAVRSVAGG